MNAYSTEFLARDHIATMVIGPSATAASSTCPSRPRPVRRPGARIAAWTRTIVHLVRPVSPLTAQPID